MCVLCISLDGVILRPVSVLYYLMVEKAETFWAPPRANEYTPPRITKMS